MIMKLKTVGAYLKEKVLNKRVGYACLFLLILFAGWHVVETVRGERAWNEAKARLKSAGMGLELKEYYLTPPPDSENFAKTEAFEKFLSYEARKALKNPFNWSGAKPGSHFPESIEWGSMDTGVTFDLEKLAQGYVALKPEITSLRTPGEQVLAGIKHSDENIAILLKGLEKKESYTGYLERQTPFPYDDSPAVSMMNYRNAAQNLRIRSEAMFSLNRHDEGLALIIKIFDLADTLRNEHTLIGAMIRVALMNISVEACWEAIGTGKLNKAQMETLQSRLRIYRNEAPAPVRALKLEMINGITFTENLPFNIHQLYLNVQPIYTWGEPTDSSWRGKLKKVYEEFVSIPKWCLYNLTPHSTYRRVSAPRLDEYREFIETSRGYNRGNIEKTKELYLKYESQKNSTRYPNLFLFFAPDISRCIFRSFWTWNHLHLTETACALERYKREQGAYPVTLEELVPRYMDSIPRDVMDGGPLRYALTPDKRYQLYSIGWNMKDDGGTPSVKANEPLDSQGDWAWTWPVKK